MNSIIALMQSFSLTRVGAWVAVAYAIVGLLGLMRLIAPEFYVFAVDWLPGEIGHAVERLPE